MRHRATNVLVTAILMFTAALAALQADDTQYRFRVVASGLARPVGIAVGGWKTLYFTEIPTPGVGGGLNGVSKLDLESGEVQVLHRGEPEPTHIALDRDGDLYWTCKSAGVILTLAEGEADAALLVGGLAQPSGIAVGRRGSVFFTEIPTPGVGGGANGVSVFKNGTKMVLHSGEPEPTDIAVNRHGTLYWTCKSAGVILMRRNGQTSVLLDGLESPSGIAIDRAGANLYFTEVPTPGVGGADGGSNKVSALNLRTGRVRRIHEGDPEPTDVAVAPNGSVYWTCTSAGVIVEARLTRSRH
jgi:DNA-binding beta-propeller fold protein YncE